jgi:VIT1/CCC1 family predicted Fe2+/Mn2+ transporter
MVRVAILILTPLLLGILGMAGGWWADDRPILGAVLGSITGLGIAILAIIDEGLRGRKP